MKELVGFELGGPRRAPINYSALMRFVIAAYFLSPQFTCSNKASDRPQVRASLRQKARSAENLVVPITVQEALPNDPSDDLAYAEANPDKVRMDSPSPDPFHLLSGVARVAEPVTFGLPLPVGAAITNTSQLALAGSSIAQFRALKRWSSEADSPIEWVLIDSQVTTGSGTNFTGLALISDLQGIAESPALASEISEAGTDYILVETGAAEFRVRKHGFNLLDQVRVGPLGSNRLEVVGKQASPGIVLTGTDQVAYTAANDQNVQVAIEENGPLRAVVLAKGTHYSTDRRRNLDFTVRMHFYRGKAAVRVLYSLRNASQLQVTNAPFQALELVLATTFEQPNYLVNTHAGEFLGNLRSAGENVRLFQGENAFPIGHDWDFDPGDNEDPDAPTPRWPTGIRGYQLALNGTNGSVVLTNGNRYQAINLFYAQARSADGSAAVTFGTRFAAGNWPQGLGIDGDGTIHVGLFPAGNDRVYFSRFNSHVTREVLFDFGSGPPAHDAFFRFQYPLVGKASDPDWYNQSGGFWERIVSLSDEVDYFHSQGWPTHEPENQRPWLRVWRYWYWGEVGGRNQYDESKVDLFSFLRRDTDFAGRYYLSAEQRLAYNADQAVFHSDDYDASRANEIPSLANPSGGSGEYTVALSFKDLGNLDFIPHAKVIFEGEHRHAYGLGLWYYLSGDERFREAYADWGEYMLTQSGDDDYARGLVWNIYNLVDLYRFTGNGEYRDLAAQYFADEILDRSFVSQQSRGTDYQRGYFISADDLNTLITGCTAPTNESCLVLAPFILGEMFPRTYAYFGDFGTTDPLLASRARDVLEGMVRFVSGELWYEYSDNPGDYGFPYRVSPYTAPLGDVRQQPDWYGGTREAYLTFFYGYLLTGDSEFLRRGKLLLESGAYLSDDSEWYDELPDRQSLLHLLIHGRAQYPIWKPLPLDVTALSLGGYALSWVAPAGALEYWIKYSDKPIVSWLGFDHTTRQFQFDPTTATPFFAAQNLTNAPPPALAGAQQGVLVADLDSKSQFFFSARYLADIETSPIRIQAAGFSADRRFLLEWASISGTRYQVQSSPDLRSWSDAGAPVEATAASAHWSEPSAEEAARFYRVIAVP